MDVFTLGEYAIKVAIEVGQKIKTLNTTEVDSGIAEAYKRALSDWSQHAPTSSDGLRLNAALDGYLKNATGYEALDKDTKDFIDCFKKRLSEQPAAHNFLMTLRADEQANSQQQVLTNLQTTNSQLQELLSKAESTGMTPQYVSSILKELPIQEGREITATAIKEMFESGRIHSEAAKDLFAEITNYIFQHTDNLREEIKQLHQANNSSLAETLEEINNVLTGKSEQSLTAIYEKFKEQERQNEVRALEELIEAAQIQFSFGEARTFFEKLIKLAPTVEHHFNYAFLLKHLNDFDKARSHYEEALQALRVLSKLNSGAYKPHIATTLNSLANLLSSTNELKQAQDYCEEALGIYQVLASLDPKAYKSGVAITLNNLGNLLKNTNELKQAKDRYEEAIQILLELEEKNPERYKSDVAMTLNNLGNLYCDMNEFKQARAYCTEALQMRRELAEKNPKAHKPEVAATLNNLGNLLKEADERQQAQTYYEEALQIYRELAEKNPEAYNPNVATTLNNLGVLLSIFGEFKEAQTYHKEALQIRRELAEKNPEAYKLDVATTLHNLGASLSNTNEFKQAQTCHEEALKLYQELADQNPKAYMSDVAMTLNNLVVLYMKLKKKEEAVRAYQGAYNVYKKLANLHPKAYDICYARILAIGYAFLGKPQQDLKDAKAILSKYPEHPEAQGLLSFIEGLSKREQ